MNASAPAYEDAGAWRTPRPLEAEVVVVGSGPAGSAVARVLAEAGLRVVIVEEGGPLHTRPAPPDAWTAMASGYRSMGAQLCRGPAPMPVVQGRCVGGGSVINGAIHWRLPKDVWDGWIADDPTLRTAWDWDALEAETDRVFARLSVAPTPLTLQGRNSLLLRDGAEALGIEHRPIARNTVGCRGTGRCLQGCPHQAKRHMPATLLLDAQRHGARVVHGLVAERVVHDHTRAVGVAARTVRGVPVQVRARRAVVLAASAVQTPAILVASRLGGPHVGRHFRSHPGASVLGRFPRPVRAWEGATQGWEAIGLRHRGIKLEALGMDRGVLLGRLPGLGRTWAREAGRLDHYASWGVALRAQSEGRVTRTLGRPVVHYALSTADLHTLAEGIAHAGRMMFAAGAEAVRPGVLGLPDEVTHPRALDRLLDDPPRDPRAYTAVMTHLFGTCRAHSDPHRGVVRPDLRHHTVDRLFVADSSVFPSNTGVNPQGSILALATHAARGWVSSGGAFVTPERP